MATMSVYGFRKNNTDKLSYVSRYGDIGDLGVDILHFLHLVSLEYLNDFCDSIRMVQETELVPQNDLTILKSYFSEPENEDENLDLFVDPVFMKWGRALESFEGSLCGLSYLYDDFGCAYMIDSDNLIADSNYCEHGFIINLDNNTFEYWKGLQTEADLRNRYGVQPTGLNFDGVAFFPCSLKATYLLPDICRVNCNIEEIANKLQEIAGIDAIQEVK